MLQPGAKVRHGLGSKQQQSIYNTPCAFVFVSLQMMKIFHDKKKGAIKPQNDVEES